MNSAIEVLKAKLSITINFVFIHYEQRQKILSSTGLSVCLPVCLSHFVSVKSFSQEHIDFHFSCFWRKVIVGFYFLESLCFNGEGTRVACTLP